MSQQVAQQHSPIIDVSERSSGLIAGIAAIVVMAGLIAAAAVVFTVASRGRSLPAALPSTAPTTRVEEPPPSARESAPAAEMWGDSTPPRAPPVASNSRGAAGAKGSSAPAKNPRGTVSVGQLTVSGRLGPQVIRSVADGARPRFRSCYEQGLGRSSALAGSVTARFVIGRDGSVSNVSNGGSDLADHGVIQCVTSAFYGLRFPVPEGGIVTVVYPLHFRPG